MKRILSSSILILCALAAFAQATHTIRGTVRDAQGLPIIGAAVVELGSTSNGTTTDDQGNYSLTVNNGAQIVVSCLGYRELTLPTSGRPVIDVTLQDDSQLLEGIVVTALGIKREEKALGYAVQKVGGESLQKVGGIDVGTSLSGKVAGMLVSNSTEFNAAPSIAIRGEQPLLVVDGVAYSNKTLADISAMDIETLTVLKGATASALYGFRGASGAIIVTTRNGSEGVAGITVDVSSNTMFSAGYLAIPERQGIYGRGSDNIYNVNSTSSWGTVMDGHIENQWDPFEMAYKDYAYLPVGKDNFKNFLEMGYITNNNVTVAFKGKDISLRNSFNWTENKGRYPNNKMDKFTYTIGGDVSLDRFHLSSNMSYARRHSPNQGFNGYTSYDPMYSLLIWSPSDYDIKDYKDNYWMIKGEKQNFTYQSAINNPYFDMYEKLHETTRDIFNADVTASYDVADWLTLTARGGLDFYSDKGQIKVSQGSYVSTGNTGVPGNLYPWNGTLTGAYITGRDQGFSINTDILATGAKTFLDDFQFDYLLGGTIYYTTTSNINAQTTGGISVPGFFSLKASVQQARVGESQSSQQVNSLFGRASLGWRKMLFLEVTGRNDWSSTLTAPGIDSKDKSYFYPSVSGSFAISELMPDTRDWLDLLKVRASWTQSKTPAAVFALNQAYTITTSTWNALTGATAPHTIYPSTVEPSASQTYEIGAQGIFFKNRLSVDVSYYDKNMYNSLVAASLSPASGMTSIYVNTDEAVSRRGWEVSVGGKPIETRDWQWDIAANWSTYRRIYTALDETYSSKNPWVKVGNRVDAYVTKDFLKVPGTGELIWANGRIQKSAYNSVIGYSDPDWLWGINSTLRYKGLSLFVSMDGIVGGMMSTMTENEMWRAGVHPDSTTPERAADVANPGSKNFVGKGKMVVSGTVTYDTDGNITSDSRVYETNNVASTYKQYIQDVHSDFAWGGSASAADSYSKTYLKLREISLSYAFPSGMLGRTNVLKGASISFIGQNVLLWSKDFKYSDPDGGTENFADPSVRYLGFNVKLTF